MKDALINAIRKPFTSFWGTVYGIILSLIPLLNFIAAGQILRCYQDGLKKPQPKFSSMGNFFMDGFFMSLITFAYSIPLLIYANLTNTSLFITRAFLATPIPSWMGTSADILVFKDYYILIIFLITTYLIPAAAMLYLKEEKMTAIFSPKKIKEIVLTKKYVTSYLVGSIFFLGLTYSLSFIPVIGVSIGSYVGLMIFYSLLGANK